MEHFIHTFLYSFIKGVLYVVLVTSGLGTVAIPIFFGSKMVKPQPNYVAHLTWRQRISELTSVGILFILCAFISLALGITLSKLDGYETEQKGIAQSQKDSTEQHIRFDESKKEIQSYFSDKLKMELSYNTELSKKDKLLSDKALNDSLSKTNSLIKESKLEYMNSQLRLAAEQKEKMELEKELNSPVIETYILADNSINPIITYDSNNKKYAFVFAFVNLGKGKAEKIQARFHLFDYQTRQYLYSTNGTYNDTSLVLSENTPMVLSTFFYYPNVGDCYLVAEIKYKNHFGKEMSTFLRVFKFDIQYLKVQIPKVSREEADLIKKAYYDLNLSNAPL